MHLKPTASAYNFPLQKLEKYLAAIMQPSTERAASYINNSQLFTEIINTIQIEEREIITSFGVKSLYSSIPIDEALEQIAVNEDFPDHVKNLARHCLKNGYFLYDQRYHR